MINTAFLMYNFWKAWKTDPGIIHSNREDKIKVSKVTFRYSLIDDLISLTTLRENWCCLVIISLLVDRFGSRRDTYTRSEPVL